MYVAQFLTATWTLDKMPTQDILKFRQVTWEPPGWKNWVLNIWASKFEFWSHWWPVSNNFKSWFPHNHWNPAISSKKSVWPALKRSALWKIWKLYLARFIVSRKMEMSVCSGTKPYQQICTNCNLMDSHGARLSAAWVQSQSKSQKLPGGLSASGV